jgi:hypothetical protein
MTITIGSEERDALYTRILVRLSGIDTVFRSVQLEDWEDAQQLGREFSDLLRLVCDDLGWGERDEESYSLQTPPDVLARAAEALRGLAAVDREHYERQGEVIEAMLRDVTSLQLTCDRILKEIGSSDR